MRLKTFFVEQYLYRQPEFSDDHIFGAPRDFVLKKEVGSGDHGSHNKPFSPPGWPQKFNRQERQVRQEHQGWMTKQECLKYSPKGQVVEADVLE